MSVRRTFACVIGLVLAVAGCGGGSGGDTPSPRPGTPTPRATATPAAGSRTQAAPALGFPVLATKNTTRVAGADPVADAAGVAEAVYPSRTPESHPQAVVLADRGDWRVAISAAQLMSRPLRAPVLLADAGGLPAASSAALDALQPTGAKALRGAQVVRVGTTAAAAGRLARGVTGSGAAGIAAAVDRLQARLAGGFTDAVVIASSERPDYAMPAAAWAAKSGDPVLWASRDALPAATRAAVRAHKRPKVYVLGPRSVISAKVIKALRPLSGGVQRIAGTDAVTTAIAFARFSDGRFGWNVTDPGHGLVFASARRPLDAAAGAALSASGTYGPLVLVADATGLPAPVQDYLLDIQPGYDPDPVRGVYNHGWLLGDESAISAAVQSRIDTLLEIQPVDTGAE